MLYLLMALLDSRIIANARFDASQSCKRGVACS
jgi:hypothetical protein